MSLENVEILVDGFNLELQYGTGVKTYGASLIEMINSLGGNVSILWSRGKNYKDPVLAEVSLSDVDDLTVSKLEKIKIALGLLKGALGVSRKAMQVNYGKIVIPNPTSKILKEVSTVFNVPDCYRRANLLQKRNGGFSTVRLPRKVDVWHATYPIPIRIENARKQITTIHDLVPLKLPYATLDNKKAFYKLIEKTLVVSDAIATVSNCSKQDIVETFDVNPDKIFVTYQSSQLETSRLLTLDQHNRQCTIQQNLKKYDLAPKEYFLFVGAIEPKKNVGRLIEAFAGIDTHKQLVIVGKKGWLVEAELRLLASSTRLASRVKLLNYIPNADLPSLYAGAFSLVFPSLYEGFGLPPLEAMTCGCPVITANTGSLPEVCGEAALYADPYNVSSIREQMEKFLASPVLLEDMRSRGRMQAEQFSYKRYQEKINNLYAQVL